MNLAFQFEQWRAAKRPEQSWGLAWFLASEFCKRFYASHGLIPWVIDHDGLGYYGISIHQLPCQVNGNSEDAIGRFTRGGDVENWRTGGPGDHGCELIDKCARGMATEELIQIAISYFGISPLPHKSHVNCRHKRWGASYELCFELAALVALRYEPNQVSIWNHPLHTQQAIADDSKNFLKEHPGAILFINASDETKVCIAGDGRLLDGSGVNLWHEYMRGMTAKALSNMILQRLTKHEVKSHGEAH